GCEQAAASGDDALVATRALQLADRPLQLQVSTRHPPAQARDREAAWLRRLAGLGAAGLLAMLLLIVTGSARRTRLAVHGGTASLRRQMAERAQAQDALSESESRLRSILDHVPIGVMFLDPQGRVLEANPRLCDLLGRSAAALRSCTVVDLVHPDEAPRVLALRRTLLAGAADASIDGLRLSLPRPPAGTGPAAELTVRVSASALRDARGRVLRMVSVLEDITEHLRLQASERALQRAEAASRAKSEFVSRMSHELRTPLNAMIGFAQLLGLDRSPALVAHQRDWVQQIQRAGWHLLEMINETLDLARIESGAVQLNLEPVALGPLAAACRSMLANSAQQRGVTLHDGLQDDALAVLADATRLKQVLTNLISNAIKYNREGGSVSLSARREPGGPAGAAECIAIDVADDGLGMTESQLDSLFQPYNRLGREASDIEGTGIGLVISRRLAELMGGTLEASSTAGRGSVFTLRLAPARAAAAPPLASADAAATPYQQRRVHYVEDNETNIEVMRGIFAQRPQIELQTSMLGLDGLAAIRATRPDLVLLDMQLPDISGIELLRHLKQDDRLAAIPVVIVSADATPGHMQQALVAGALHYATKPLDVAAFLRTVDGILEEVDTRWGL
ncbi:MAG: response regulator, partial [Burkholderiales bacterium]|nr:response regulator [Burkholderiales bacterium]